MSPPPACCPRRAAAARAPSAAPAASRAATPAPPVCWSIGRPAACRGLYCERPIADLRGTCKAVPQGCGEREGGPCCPPGFYGGPGGRITSAPFCRGGGAGGSLRCAGPLGAPAQANCAAWPAFPDACGRLGAPCCPEPTSWLEDGSSPPPQCEDGAECPHRSDGGNACAPAPPCGEQGHAASRALLPDHAGVQRRQSTRAPTAVWSCLAWTPSPTPAQPSTAYSTACKLGMSARSAGCALARPTVGRL